MPRKPKVEWPIKLTPNLLAVANAAAKDTSRPVLNAVHVEDGRVVAADGYILVAAEVPTPKGTNMNVPVATFKKAPKGGKWDDVELHEDGKLSCGGSSVDNALVDGTFPDGEAFRTLAPGKHVTLALAPELLKKLLSSIGDATILRLYVPTVPNNRIHFEANTEERHHGAIMPLFGGDGPFVHKAKRRRKPTAEGGENGPQN